MKTAITLLATSTFLLNHINAKTVEESSTGALLTFPSVIDGPLYKREFDVAPAQFGYQKYGGTLEGVLVLPANETYHKECPKCGSGVNSMCTPEGPEPLDTNPYIHYIRDWFISQDDITDYILVIDRLDCYFVNKIEHAQQMGASGVIMCDWRNENLFTMWMPQDWSDDIDIPSVLLNNTACKILMEHLGVQNWDPLDKNNMKYPTPENMNWTIATIEWGLPHPDDIVEYELWTSSNDYLGSQFKHNFNDTAIALDKAGDTVFTPHMYILNGSHWNCDDMFNGSYTLPCKRQCSNTGRYCAVDPEYDLTIGLDGIDVVQENLRSLCVWEYDKENFGNDDVMWWDYAVLWDENCGVYSNTSMNFHEACSFAQMDKLKTDQSLSQYVSDCIANSGGYGYEDGPNTILKRETKLKYNSSIYTVPLVKVNEFLIHGNIDCEPPVTASTCEVLAAICAGFLEGTQPDVCFLTPSPTIANCSDSDRDCAGTCYGNYIYDACGKCLPVSSHDFNECIGCNGVVNGTYDCAGTCGGTYAVNPCGYCKDTRQPEFKTFGVDCKGGCDMRYREDECGQCLIESESPDEWNNCVDCAGEPNGGKIYNDCDFCLDPTNTAIFENYGKDCRGVCEATSIEKWEMDKCGKCLMSSDPERDACVDCAGEPNGDNEYNDCGFCLNKNDADFANYGQDCRGQCEGTSIYKWELDKCGLCLMSQDSRRDACVGCDGVAWSNKTFNDCGSCVLKTDPAFDSYGRDCRGKCATSVGETYYTDDCGQCLLPTDERWDYCVTTQADNVQKKESELTTIIVVVVIVAFLIIVAACIIIGALWKKQTTINARFDSLAATYVHMDEDPKHNFPMGSSSGTNRRGLQTVPDEEDDGEDQ